MSLSGLPRTSAGSATLAPLLVTILSSSNCLSPVRRGRVATGKTGEVEGEKDGHSPSERGAGAGKLPGEDTGKPGEGGRDLCHSHTYTAPPSTRPRRELDA